MSVEAMKPLGLAVKEYYEGNKKAFYTLYRDDGKKETCPVSVYFRQPKDFYSAEKQILEFCRGKVLVAGAGAGAHSLELQDRGCQVLAIDISPENCEVLKKRGQKNVLCFDFLSYRGEMFDTICLLGRNIGMTEKLANLSSFFNHINSLLKPAGMVFLNSWDFRYSQDPLDITYRNRNENHGRYFGEVKYRMEYKGIEGKELGWLYLDFETLKNFSGKAGLSCEIITKDLNGNFLAKLTK